MCSIIIADSSILITSGFRLIIESRSGYKVSAVNDPGLLPRILQNTKPQLLIIEYDRGENWMGKLVEYKSKGWINNILVTAWSIDELEIKALANNGVTGFILKNAELTEIKESIESCMESKHFYSREILDILLHDHQEDEVLTARELQVLKLVAKGKSTREIANELYLSVHTINSHRKNIIKKLNIQSPVEFVRHAMDRQLI